MCVRMRKALGLVAIVAGMELPFKRWFGLQCPNCDEFEYIGDIDMRSIRQWSEGSRWGLGYKEFQETEFKHRACGHVWTDVVRSNDHK